MRQKKQTWALITDHLTKLYNRRHFDKRLKEIIDESKKEEKYFTLLMTDIDSFKTVNDRYGHLAGDKILTDLARVLKNSVRGFDICFRYGGDEIAIILPNTDRNSAQRIIKRLQREVESYRFSTDSAEKLSLTMSIGLAIFPNDGIDSKTLIKKADTLLYDAKRQRKRSGEPFILKSKLVMPALKINAILRQRLVSLMKENLDKKLILLIGDAGYGKTTLSVQFVKEAKIPFIWYQIDKTDQEIDVLMRYLIEGLRRYVPEFGRRTINVIEHCRERGIDIEILVGTFINELIEIPDHNFLFFFDDLQEAYCSRQVMAGIEYLLNHMPPNISMIIAARSNPPFPLERPQFKNEVLSIDQEDLRFNKDEIRLLCEQVAGYTPNREELKELMADSEGWITALQFLVPIVRQKSIFVKRKRSLLERLNDYFEREVFSTLEEDTKLFLTATSVFEHLSPAACDFLLKINGSEQILKELEKRHLFISANESYLSFRYHHLFRDFLNNKLRINGQYKKFQNRAGRYWQKNRVFRLALQHFTEANNFRSTGRLLEKFGKEYFNIGKVEFVKRYVDLLPDDIVKKSSTLMRFRGRICEWKCDWEHARLYYVRAKRIAQQQKKYPEVFMSILVLLEMKLYLGEYKSVARQIKKILRGKALRNQRQRMHYLNLLGWSLSYEGKIDQEIAVYQEMLKGFRKLKYRRGINVALNNLALAHIESGDYRQTQEYLDPLIVALRANPAPLLIFCLINLGNALKMQGNITEAVGIHEEAMKYARLFNDKRRLIICYFNLGDTKIYSGELDKAEQLLKEAESMARIVSYKFILGDIWEAMAKLAIHRRDFIEAKKYINRALELPVPVHPEALHRLVKSGIELSLKNYRAAGEILSGLSPNLNQAKWPLTIFHLQLTRLYLSRNNFGKAKYYLNKTISLVEENRFDYLFSHELKFCPDVLRLIYETGPRYDYLKHILLRLPYLDTVAISAEPDLKKFDVVIRLFGKVQIFKKGTEIKIGAWKTKRFHELFCFFAINHRLPISREKIAGIFWPEHSLATTRQLFHNAVYGIRKTVGRDIIKFDNSGYILSPRFKYWIDALEFERLINQGNDLSNDGDQVSSLIKYEEALALYRGEFMDDFYSEWCQEKRKYLDESYLTILKKLSAGHYSFGNFEKALRFCNLSANKDPYDEEISCLAMQCYARLNDRRGLENCFRNLKKNLAKGLRTTPGAETTRLFEKLIKERNP